MRPPLIVGLGNPLAGDDGVGPRLALAARSHPDLPAGIEVMAGGTDLLRLGPALAERRHVVLVDAWLSNAPPGTALVLPRSDDAEVTAGGSAHRIPALEALALLRLDQPELAAVPCTWFLVAVPAVSAEPALSARLTAALPALLKQLLAVVRSVSFAEAS
jgi:hydrogenase maturation protease